jgi:phenylacetate-CoA ligase
MDEMGVHVELAEGTPDAAADGAVRELAAKIKSNVGVTAKVHLAPRGKVARSEGKAVRLIDNRPKGG